MTGVPTRITDDLAKELLWRKPQGTRTIVVLKAELAVALGGASLRASNSQNPILLVDVSRGV
jgi:hypothetical protein